MIEECLTVEMQRREHEAARQQFNALQPVGIPPTIPTLPAKPTTILGALAVVRRKRMELCAAIGRREGVSADYVHRRSLDISHDSSWMNQDDALEALRSGAVKV